MSAHFEQALASWRECRAEYDLVLYAQYEAAEDATRGALLNDRGRAAGVDPITLFMGPAQRAAAYASEELIEHWQEHPRTPFARFERQWMQTREAMYA